MRKFFNESNLQTEYEKKGYLKVRLFDKETAGILSDQSAKYMREGKGFYTLVCNGNDPAEKEEIFNLIWDKFSKALSSIFLNFSPIKGTFLIKVKGKEGDFPPHQDWSIVDENEHRGFTVWCPLVPTNIHNGALHLVPGTHKLNSNPRSVPLSIFPYKEDKFTKLFKKYAEMVETEPGEAIIFDNKVIHFSLENHSDTKRVVAGLIMVPTEAPTQYYCYSREGKEDILDICKVDKECLFALSHEELPLKTEVIGHIPVPKYPEPYREVCDVLNHGIYAKIKNKLRSGILAR